MHWADKPSLLLLRHLARSIVDGRVLIVGAYRDVELDRTHPLAEVLAAMRRERPYTRVLVRGLPESDVIDLIESIGETGDAGSPLRQLGLALYRETEGNPFFIREVVSHLIEERLLYRDGGRWTTRVSTVSELGIPEGVREAIGRRLSRLSEGCGRMLSGASAMTAGFSWDELKAISGEEEGVLLDVHDEAIAAQLISERKGEGGGRYDFTHALIRQTLYEELSTPRRVLLHRQIGEALEQLYTANVEPHLAELAHHFYQAAPGGDAEKAIDYARRAGDRAASLFAHEEAIAQYDRALGVIEIAPVPDEQRRCELLLPLAAEQRWSGEYARAAETYGRAAIAARQSGDALLFAKAALSQAATLASLDPLAVPTDFGRLLEEARALLPVEDSGVRASVLSMIALGRGDRALAAEALAMARRVGDTFQLGNVLSREHNGWGSADPEAQLAIADEMFTIATQLGDRRLLIWSSANRIPDLAQMGRVEEARAANERLHALALETRWPEIVCRAMASNACFLLSEGKFTEAATAMEQSRVYGREHVLGGMPELAFGAQSFNLGHLQGRLEVSEPGLRALVQQYPWQSVFRGMLAFLHSETGREDEARQEFEALAQDDFTELQASALELINLQQLSETCATLGDAQRASVLYDLLLPYAGRNIIVGQPFFCTGSASRQLGMMAAVMERYDAAERHFEDALAFDQKMGARPWVAHDQYNYAKMLLARAAPGDRDRALALLQAALDTAEELGMKKIIERALALKVKAQGIDSGST